MRSLFAPLALALLACSPAPGPTDSGGSHDDASTADTNDAASNIEDAAQMLDSADTATLLPTADYATPGPLSAMIRGGVPLSLPTSTGCSGNDCNVTVYVTTPSGTAEGRSAPYPVVVFSSGFRVPASQYLSYAVRLARWGYVVVRWDTTTEGGVIPRSISHRVLGNMVRALPDQVAHSPELGALMDTQRVVFAGHSRGGKISALALAGNPNARGFVGFDPVDAPPPMTPAGPEYPSGAAVLRSFSAPSVVLGAALGAVAAPGSFNMPCAPSASNYTTFFANAQSPATQVVLAQTGHMQFLDDQASCPPSPLGGTICSLCTAGSTPDATVRDAAIVLLTALSEAATRGVDASAYLSPTGRWLSMQSGLSASSR